MEQENFCRHCGKDFIGERNFCSDKCAEASIKHYRDWQTLNFYGDPADEQPEPY